MPEITFTEVGMFNMTRTVWGPQPSTEPGEEGKVFIQPGEKPMKVAISCCDVCFAFVPTTAEQLHKRFHEIWHR